MREIIESINVGFAAIGGFLGWLFGGLDGFLYALIVFVIVDYFTGVMAACVQKKLSSEIGFKGIARKVTIFLLVAIANMVDVDIIQTGNAVRTAVIFFYLSNEGISILENAAIIGLPIPQKLKNVLLQIGDAENGD
ncbi:MAG: phage holin family protein [Clostridia bacterium]|nr:phage holin family protein [Clostridia bacterium]